MPDTPEPLNAISVLTRREIEARLVAPLIEAFSITYGREQTLAILSQVVAEIARQQGKELAKVVGGTGLADFAATLDNWKKENALTIEVLEQNEKKYLFHVTHCRYAEMYQNLGIPGLGSILSCNRDQAFIEGFNPSIQFTRTQTIMEGAPFCDFCYTMKEVDK